MTNEQALEVVNQAASVAPLTRQQHAQVVEAVKVLQEAIKPKAEKK